MQVYKADVADIQRSVHRDESFINELQENFTTLLKLLGNETYNSFRKFIPVLASSWYYFATSLSNRQTLGEEYAGIVRVVSGSLMPSKVLQLIWLLLFLGGDYMYDQSLNKITILVQESQHLQPDKKELIFQFIEFLKTKKNMFKAMHRSLFFINGAYSYLSNRITGIKFILLRQWMQDSTYTQSFKWLGRTTLAYLIFRLIKDWFSSEQNKNVVYRHSTNISSKICALCGESRKNTSATPCGHLFCWNCIHDCILYQANCPLCRDFIKPSRIICLQNYT